MNTPALSLSTLSGLLIDGRRRMESEEAEWLDWLAEFYLRGGWALEGHISCVSWLMDKCGMSRPTAKDRLRIALELQQRPILAQAFAAGRVSYSKIRAITRIKGVDDEADRAFLVAADKGTATDMENLYRQYKVRAEQDTPPKPKWLDDQVGVGVTSRFGGNARLESVLPMEEAERFLAAIDAEVKRRGPVDSAVSTGDDPLSQLSWRQRRALVLCDILDAGIAHLASTTPFDVEQAVVNVICDYETLVNKAQGRAELDGGFPISGETARRLACDAGLVRIIAKGDSEVLDIGRKTREWNTAQRRAIRFRYGGRCAFPGCENRITQVHHSDPWHPGGRTDLDLGVPLCRGHHDLVHKGGWTVQFDTTGREAVFTSPKGDVVRAATGGELRWSA